MPVSTNHLTMELAHIFSNQGLCRQRAFCSLTPRCFDWSVITNIISTPRAPCSSLPLLVSIPYNLSQGIHFLSPGKFSCLLSLRNGSQLTPAHTPAFLPTPNSSYRHSISMVDTPQLQEDNPQTWQHPFFPCSKQNSKHTEGSSNTWEKGP